MKNTKRYVIGVDIGGTNAKVAVVGLNGRIYRKKVFPTKKFPQKRSLINELLSNIRNIISESRIRKNEVLGIGVGTPGLVDSKRGIIHYLVNIKGFRKVYLKKIIEKKVKIPTFLDNDANIMCLGELHYGGGKGMKNIVCITLGTGIGGGIVIEGEIYRGTSLSAGEVGHITINEKGPRCNCGNHGCMETYAGNTAIVKDAVKRIRRTKKSIIYKLVEGDLSKITPKVISTAAKRGDKIAKDVLKEAGRHIGVGLANIINILNPEKIIIGGGVAEAGKILFDAIRDSVDERAMEIPARTVKIVKARLGKDAGLIGAAALVKRGIKC